MLQWFIEGIWARLGFYHHANSDAWMTRILFLNWLVRLNENIKQAGKMQVLLRFDNCTAHSNAYVLSSLPDFTVRFLSSQNTGGLPPYDAGIIFCLKALYKREPFTLVLDNFEVNAKDCSNIDILITMCWIQDWSGLVTMDTIRHCGKHCFKNR